MFRHMARPREFDREEALLAAMAVFWARGYEAASTQELLEAMRISRQSLYDTFGDKKKLYLEALGRYNSDSVTDVIGQIRKPESPLEGLQNVLVAFASKPARENALGCMGINAVCEFGTSDMAVAELTKVSDRILERTVEQAIAEGKKRLEIPASVDARAATRFFLATLAGMKVAAKGGATARELNDIARFAMRSLQ
jgi:TetR/AcrR family transcriptional repressor of nem operon